MRAYPGFENNFVRVVFTDEANLKFRFDKDFDGPAFIRNRVGGILRQGLVVAARKFEFLAYSMSALRDHAVWFIEPFEHRGVLVNADHIRQHLGEFTPQMMKYPSLYGARMSQAFTATEPSLRVEADRVLEIPDIERNRCSC